MTITLAAVYAPIGFQGGLTGTLFREFAFTLVGAVIISGIVALTLSPMMCSRLLAHDADKRGFAHFLDATFDKLRDRYEATCSTRVMQTWPVMLIVPVVALALLWPFYTMTKQELAPDEDQGIIIALSTGAADANVDQTAALRRPGGEDLPVLPGDAEHLPALRGDLEQRRKRHRQHRHRRHGVQALERAQAGHDRAPAAGHRQALRRSPASRRAAFLRPPLPGGGAGACRCSSSSCRPTPRSTWPRWPTRWCAKRCRAASSSTPTAA